MTEQTEETVREVRGTKDRESSVNLPPVGRQRPPPSPLRLRRTVKVVRYLWKYISGLESEQQRRDEAAIKRDYLYSAEYKFAIGRSLWPLSLDGGLPLRRFSSLPYIVTPSCSRPVFVGCPEGRFFSIGCAKFT